MSMRSLIGVLLGVMWITFFISFGIHTLSTGIFLLVINWICAIPAVILILYSAQKMKNIGWLITIAVLFVLTLFINHAALGVLAALAFGIAATLYVILWPKAPTTTYKSEPSAKIHSEPPATIHKSENP